MSKPAKEGAQTEAPPEKYYKAMKIETILGISRSVLIDWAHRRIIPHIRIPGQGKKRPQDSLFFKISEVEAFMDSHKDGWREKAASIAGDMVKTHRHRTGRV